MPIPNGSRPVVMLYGLPLCIMMKGETLSFHGSGMLVPITPRRISANEEGSHSACDGLGGGPGGPGGCDPVALGQNDTNSSNALFEAVKQLGLRLEPRKAPFDTIVVDHLEKTPTDN